MKLRKAKTANEKKEALFAYAETFCERKEREETCQFLRSGKCSISSNVSCVGCKFYKMGMWTIYERLYDIIAYKNEIISGIGNEKYEDKN